MVSKINKELMRLKRVERVEECIRRCAGRMLGEGGPDPAPELVELLQSLVRGDGRQIFTKQFPRLRPSDQHRVLVSILTDTANQCPRFFAAGLRKIGRQDLLDQMVVYATPGGNEAECDWRVEGF